MATELVEILENTERAPQEIEVPAATAWPLVLAFGFALVFAGLLTSVSVSLLGAILTVAGCVGWFGEVFPHEHEIRVTVSDAPPLATTARHVVERLPVAADQMRAWLPLHTHPISTGVKGGLAGSVAMAVLACAYGMLKAGSAIPSLRARAMTSPLDFMADLLWCAASGKYPAQPDKVQAD